MCVCVGRTRVCSHTSELTYLEFCINSASLVCLLNYNIIIIIDCNDPSCETDSVIK